MSNSVLIGMTKWLETGELCEAIFADTGDLRQFADEWDMMLEGDPIPQMDLEPPLAPYKHPVPLVICDVSLDDNHHKFADVLDGLLALSDATTEGTICRLMERLFFEGFKAGMKHQSEQHTKPTTVVGQ